jgi:plasmid maintenance system antidote protein VapI
MDTLRDFVLAEIQKRYMSEREFARLVGVAHTTIGYILHPERSKGRELTASFVIKLAHT